MPELVQGARLKFWCGNTRGFEPHSGQLFAFASRLLVSVSWQDSLPRRGQAHFRVKFLVTRRRNPTQTQEFSWAMMPALIWAASNTRRDHQRI